MTVLKADSKIFVIAELSANHNQSISVAKESIHAMKESGADAVKLQTYTPDTLTIDCDNEYFQIRQGTLWDGQTLYELYKKAYTPWEWHYELKELADKLGLVFFSTPFDKTSVDFLEKLNVPIYKIASFEITDIPLIEYVSSKKKPVIISTGIATLEDIELAVATCRNNGCKDITLLKCTSSYPAPIEEANLLTIPDMAKRFDVKVGLSDHTLGISMPIAAVSLGATVIEKHFILDRKIGGPDAAFSLEPKEFGEMARAIREVEKGLGSVSYEVSDRVKKNRIFARSLFAVENISEGEVITESNVRSIRPGYGLHPKYLKGILGKKVNRNIIKGEPIKFEDILF